jgi:uridine phosphorylase
MEANTMNFRSQPFTDAQGNMFHTGLGKGDIAPSVLMPGDLARSKIISECFDDAQFVQRRRTYVTYTGKTPGTKTPISVVSSGMGPLAVSTVAEELAHLGLQNLIRVGTGAALMTDYEPGRIIIATGCVRGDGCSYEYVPPEFPAVADFYIVKALIQACAEFGENPIVGLYRAHDSSSRETSTAMIDTYERMKPWVDAGVKMVENESATLFTVAHRLGIRAGSICVSHTSMIEDTVYYEGPPSRQAYPWAFEEGFMEQRILQCSKIAVRAVELLDDMLRGE